MTNDKRGEAFIVEYIGHYGVLEYDKRTVVKLFAVMQSKNGKIEGQVTLRPDLKAENYRHTIFPANFEGESVTYKRHSYSRRLSSVS